MPKAIEQAAREPAAPQERLVVYITRDQAQWLDAMQRQARNQGRRLSASAIVRALLDEAQQEQ